MDNSTIENNIVQLADEDTDNNETMEGVDAVTTSPDNDQPAELRTVFLDHQSTQVVTSRFEHFVEVTSKSPIKLKTTVQSKSSPKKKYSKARKYVGRVRIRQNELNDRYFFNLHVCYSQYFCRQQKLSYSDRKSAWQKRLRSINK